VGLLFGLQGPGTSLQVRDADDIPTEISDTSKLQVDLHKAVFPQHHVVGWYRATSDGDEPTLSDLKITQTLKAHYAPSEPFCFCLLQVQKTGKDDEKMKTDEGTAGDTFINNLPINLYKLHQVEGNSILLGLSDWELTTSDSERIAVERVMKERPAEIDDGSSSHNPYVLETKAMETSLVSMKDRVHVLVSLLEDMQTEKIPYDPVMMRRIQGLVASLGPLAKKATDDSCDEDVQMLAHLAIVARTINSMQSYSEKFRTVHENRVMSKEMRRPF
jgi:hypothetical protein